MAKSTRKVGRKKQPKASPSRIAERQRQAQALEFRIGGMDFQEIADELGYAGKRVRSGR